jgi:predicted DNA-binding transcriptional regulator AlpA
MKIMITCLGVNYITDKEAAYRYGYSQSWFRKRRREKKYPRFVKFPGKGKIFYPVNETDEWFRDNIISSYIV